MAPRFNLHNHTSFSDGKHAPRVVAEAAVAAGLSHLGISDHFQSTKLPPERAVKLEALDSYTGELRAVASEFEGRVKLLAGIEINFSLIQTDLSFLSRVDPEANPLNKLDYVLFEYVNDAEWFGLGVEELIRIRPFFTVPVGLAHNDLDRNFAGAVEPATLAGLLAHSDIFVELCPTARNSREDPSGWSQPYYRVDSPFLERFWQAARVERLGLSIGCDVHADLADVGAIDDATRFLEERGLQENAVVTAWDKE